MTSDFSDSRGIPYAPKPTACEVTCRRCGTPFEVMRLRRGQLKCPHCRAEQGNAISWRPIYK